ncbi:MAG: exonuclease SbcCD subunit D [Candidatus Promineifilaceae bacterium]
MGKSAAVRVLHFADAHIDIANYGRHDPDTALPVRVMDFLRSLDQIVDAAIEEQVDLVIFAGDAYKDRNPQPTFQRAWGERMMRLSAAKIPTILLVGNHDVAPAAGRANTLHEFKTLQVPFIHMAGGIELLGPDELQCPVQVISVPWVSRSQLMTREETAGKSLNDVLQLLEEKVTQAVQHYIETADPDLPLILTAHASVGGAKFGSERAVMLGHELVLSSSIIRDPRLDYVALGHIHKHQSVHDGHPPAIYPGSIERIDFGEVKEQKGYVIAEISRGKTEWQFIKLHTRRFLDIKVETRSAETFMADVMQQLPKEEEVVGAVCRVRLSYPRDWEPLVDEVAIANRFKEALSLQIQKNRLTDKRARLGDTAGIESLNSEELLGQYWRTIDLDTAETEVMQKLAKEIFIDVDGLEVD